MYSSGGGLETAVGGGAQETWRSRGGLRERGCDLRPVSCTLRQTERNHLRIFKKRKEIIQESFRRILKKLDTHKKNRQGELSQNFESTLDTGDESRGICFFFLKK
jgi:hypothetical protein